MFLRLEIFFRCVKIINIKKINSINLIFTSLFILTPIDCIAVSLTTVTIKTVKEVTKTIVGGNSKKDYITINNIKIESMKMISPELEITLNLSRTYNFLPVIINRVNQKNHYRLTLREFKELP